MKGGSGTGVPVTSKSCPGSMRPALGRTQYLRHDQRKSGSQCLGRGSYCFGAVVLTCRRAHISLNASGAERDASGLVYLEREWCRGRVLDCQGLRHLDGKGACAKLRQYKPTGCCSISRRDGPRWHVRRKFSSKGSMSTDMVVVVRLAMLDRADYAMWSNQGWGGGRQSRARRSQQAEGEAARSQLRR